MSKLEQLKAERRKELLAILEKKQKELLKHVEESANKSIDAGKGLIAIGASVLLLYTILDRFLDSKFRPQNTSDRPTAKSSSNKILYPIFSMLLQQGSSALFDEGQKRLVDYLKNKKQFNERVPGGLSKK